ncbi:MAG: hypothetical protein EU549_00445 [Promethearchaeota archaeon]|nr:MAG: hypothetical protein EU549_00445 [Candidatus Lokiarchaeota archaeon]
MALGIADWTVLIITIAFGVLIVIFIVQALINKRYAWAFLTSLVFGFLAGLAAILNKLIFSGYFIWENFFQSVHLNLYGFHFFFFFIFFERLISKKLNSVRLSVVFGLLLTQTIGLWLVFYFRINGLNTDIAWVLADIGYWTPALFVYFLGISIYIRTYLYTREIKPIILCVALIFVSIGFVFSFLSDLDFILGVFDISITIPEIISDLAAIANVFPSIGIMMFVITYLVNINYLYRVPFNVYLLVILTKYSGTPLYGVELKARKKVQIEKTLLSGMITAINNVFTEIFRTDTNVRNISSRGIKILMESGEHIDSIVITDRESYFLSQGLNRFTKLFEKKYAKELQQGARNLYIFKDATYFLKKVFPFFIIEEEMV